jgi:(p)ppGpp synthase/HD superfamily hydrolase
MKNNNQIMKARDFAVRAHADQNYGDQPYSVHLDAVADILWDAGYTDTEQLQVAFLHDVIEDTPETGATLVAAGFSGDVVNAVVFCTDLDGPNRKTRKALTYEKMEKLRDQYAATREADHQPHRYVLLGMRAKLADRLANVSQSIAYSKFGLLKMYEKEKDSFRDALYLPGVADGLWAIYDSLLGD